MSAVHEYERFRAEVQLVLQSKIEEFLLLGYGSITEQELWDFLLAKKWRRPKEDMKLFEIVEDVLAVKPGDYMNFAAVSAMKGTDFSLDDEEELKALLQ